MKLSEAIELFRRIPSYVSRIREVADATSPIVAEAIDVYNRVASMFKRPQVAAPSNATTSDIAQLISNNLPSLVSGAKSASLTVNTAVSKTMSLGNLGEDIHDTAMRLKDDPAQIANVGVFNTVLTNVDPIPVFQDSVNLMDFGPQLVNLHPEMRVQASNGGTIDVYAVDGALGTAASAFCGSAAGAIVYVSTMNSSDSCYANVTLADNAHVLTGCWWKSGVGRRTVSIGVYSTAGTFPATDPTFQIIIPAGVPSGRLRITGTRHGIGSLYANAVTTGTSLTNQYGFDTTGCTVAVSDASNDYWTWADAAGNEENCFSRSVSKSNIESTTITVTANVTTTAVVAFTMIFEVDYFPRDVKLSDLGYLNVDIAQSDPIDRAIELMRLYDSYCAARSMLTFIEVLNERSGWDLEDSALEPVNWNTFSFDSFPDFLDAFLEVYQLRRHQLLHDVGFCNQS